MDNEIKLSRANLTIIETPTFLKALFRNLHSRCKISDLIRGLSKGYSALRSGCVTELKNQGAAAFHLMHYSIKSPTLVTFFCNTWPTVWSIFMGMRSRYNSQDSFITTHLGLGDHILCNGLYKEMAKGSRRCLIPVRESNLVSVSQMLYENTNIELVTYPPGFERPLIYSHRDHLQESGVRIINLGYFGKNFMSSKGRTRFDEDFYAQAELDFDLRWDKFSYQRNEKAEQELFEILGADKGPYIFLHEDPLRNFRIKREYLPAELRIIQPIANHKHFRFFDYRLIIERASEIHVIESSFCAFIESLGLRGNKFAHRYSRPEASGDFRHEFTYRSNWTVYTR